MATAGAVQVRCPECDVAVPIATEITSTGIEGKASITSAEPDLIDGIIHVCTHE